MKSHLTILFAALAAVAAFAPVAAQDIHPVEDTPAPLSRPYDPKLPTLFIVGDSTVENSNAGHLGWGQPLADYFAPAKLNVINAAIGGRSSRSFREEGRWAKVLDQARPGDVILIQFGHNDGGSPDDPKRGDRATLKGEGEETVAAINPKTQQPATVHSYGWYMRQYVIEAKAKGVTPILCSLIPRKIWDADGKIVRGSADYGLWAKDAAIASGAAFIDLNEIIAERYDAMGADKVAALFSDDHTHTNPAGAEINAAAVVSGLKALPNNPLAPYLSSAADKIAPFAAVKTAAPQAAATQR